MAKRTRVTLKTAKKKPPRLKLKDAKDDLLFIPRVFNRSRWTEKDHERNKEAWSEVVRKQREEQAAAQRRLELLREKQAEKARMKAKRKAKRDERRQARAERKAEVRAISVRVLEALEHNMETIREIREYLDVDENRTVRRGLRLLIKEGKASKVPDKRRYTLPWKLGKAPETKDKSKRKKKRERVRLPKRSHL